MTDDPRSKPGQGRPSQQPVAPGNPLFRIFDTFFKNDTDDLADRTWTPPVDIQETDDSFRIYAELPGLTRDDIEITLEDNLLRLSGLRKFEKDQRSESYHRIERTYCTFSRAFALPARVISNQVEATFDKGVLSIVVPKVAVAKPRNILQAQIHTEPGPSSIEEPVTAREGEVHELVAALAGEQTAESEVHAWIEGSMQRIDMALASVQVRVAKLDRKLEILSHGPPL